METEDPTWRLEVVKIELSDHCHWYLPFFGCSDFAFLKLINRRFPMAQDSNPGMVSSLISNQMENLQRRWTDLVFLVMGVLFYEGKSLFFDIAQKFSYIFFIKRQYISLLLEAELYFSSILPNIFVRVKIWAKSFVSFSCLIPFWTHLRAWKHLKAPRNMLKFTKFIDPFIYPFIHA